MNKGVSVIIPVYNAEKYLENCLASLSLQTLNNIEFIFVIDRNSTDKSEEILKNSKLRNMKILKPTDGEGAGYNRNIGINEANCEYTGFVDADDCISKDFFEKLYNKGIEENADIVMGETIVVDENQNITDYYKYPDCTKTGLSEIFSVIEFSTVWDKIYRSSIAKQIKFPEKVIHEDNVFTLCALMKGNKLVIVPKAIYYWLRNPNSVTMNAHKSAKCIDDAYIIFNKILDILYKSDLTLDEKTKIINHNIGNYAIDAILYPQYRNYFMEKLKILLGKQKAYKIFFDAEKEINTQN